MTASRDPAQHMDEELRLLNGILAALQENNRMPSAHNSVASSIDDRVRKIGVNTSNMR